jgi:osmotically-inducible protein OsmY
MKPSAVILTFWLFVTLATGCGGTVKGTTDDATITTRVKILLLNEVMRPERIDVRTFKGVVTLSGRISTKDQEAKAIELARKVRGVKDVKSTLNVER